MTLSVRRGLIREPLAGSWPWIGRFHPRIEPGFSGNDPDALLGQHRLGFLDRFAERSGRLISSLR
jgi:hypothetical protein